MTATIWNQDALDFVERENFKTFLEPHFGPYLDFHNANCHHLPDNFLTQAGSVLDENDPRREWIDRVGFLNYSIFINLLLAWNAAEEETDLSPQDVLNAYDLLSRVYPKPKRDGLCTLWFFY